MRWAYPTVEAISSIEYKTAATRPRNSQLDCSAFSSRFGIKLRHWTEATAETVLRCLSN